MSPLSTLRSLTVWLVIPGMNFLFFVRYSRSINGKLLCETTAAAKIEVWDDSHCASSSLMAGTAAVPSCATYPLEDPLLLSVDTNEFDSYRARQLAPAMREYGDTLILQLPLPAEGPEAADVARCAELHQHYASSGDNGQCFAVAWIDARTAVTRGTIILRFDDAVDAEGHLINDPNAPKKVIDKRLEAESKGLGDVLLNADHKRPAGHFRRVPKIKGFARVYEKLYPFLRNLEGPGGMNEQLKSKLEVNGVKAGDDVVMMVVNEGEIDLFLNFACSCRLHGISLRGMLVFSGSPEIVSIIESTGAMGLFHEGYASVSKAASVDYLDRVFVDMMWYKAFSVHLLLRQRVNVLFQDVDLVWFKDPFPYFHEFLRNSTRAVSGSGNEDGSVDESRAAGVQAFFTDDGNRSKRYSPLFFNSGFYYLLYSKASEYFSWSIMTAFDAVQVTGSHQNVFTLRLIEGFGLGPHNAQVLSLEQFPNGILYHHDRSYMKRLYDKKVQPYHFHMCWTQGKPDKLKYLRKALMWYLTDTCSPLESLVPGGAVYEENARAAASGGLQQQELAAKSQRWDVLAHQCCTRMPNAP